MSDETRNIEAIRARLREVVEHRVRRLIENVGKEHGLTRYGLSFGAVPYIGENYLSARTKILVCGRSGDRAGYSREERSLADVDFDGDWCGDHFRIQEKLLEGVGHVLTGEEGDHEQQRWWRSVYNVAAPLVDSEATFEDQPSDEGIGAARSRKTLNSVAYSSVDKLSGLSGLRRSELERLFTGISTLKEEIEILEPDIVWFPTGFDYDKVLRMNIGYFDLDELSPLGMALVHSSTLRKSLPEGAFAIRTFPPESGWFDKGIVSRQIVELAKSEAGREIRHVGRMADRLSRLERMSGWSASEDPSYVSAKEAISSASKHLREYRKNIAKSLREESK